MVRGQCTQTSVGKQTQLRACTERTALQRGSHQQHLRRRKASARLCRYRGAGKDTFSKMVREVKKCCTYCTVRTVDFAFSPISFPERRQKRALKIKPCAIREDLHRRKYQKHPLVIYGTVKPFHGSVAFLPVRSTLPLSSKTDRVLL